MAQTNWSSSKSRRRKWKRKWKRGKGIATAITDLNEHWHVCIITLFTAYSGLSLSLERYWTWIVTFCLVCVPLPSSASAFVCVCVTMNSNLTPLRRRPIKALKPSSVKYVYRRWNICDIIYTMCDVLERLGYCRMFSFALITLRCGCLLEFGLSLNLSQGHWLCNVIISTNCPIFDHIFISPEISCS